MKIVIVFIVSYLMLIQSSLVFGDEGFDGYTWEELTFDNKAIVLSGFLHGFMFGEVAGKRDGRISVIKEMDKMNLGWTKTEFEEEAKKSNKEATEIKAKIQIVRLNVLEQLIRNGTKFDQLKDDVGYYVKETDSFLKTFPLCKRRNMFELFSNLINVWLNDSSSSYKKVGDACLEVK